MLVVPVLAVPSSRSENRVFDVDAHIIYIVRKLRIESHIKVGIRE